MSGIWLNISMCLDDKETGISRENNHLKLREIEKLSHTKIFPMGI